MTYAVIVTYNPEMDLLNSQYESLCNQVDGIVYVDNGSNIEMDCFRKKHESVYYINNDNNLGLGYAQNQGIQRALELGANFVLLLDQDSELLPSMVQDLKNTYWRCISKGEKVGAVAPGIVNAFDESSPVFGILISGIHIKYLVINDVPLEVSYCIASGTLIHKSVFEDVGMMNEYMFIDFIDLEWCMRARKSGYKIFISAKARLHHRLGNGEKDKIKSHSTSREYYICRNSFYLIRLNYIPLGFKYRRFVLIPFRVLRSLCRGDFSYFAMGIKGMVDGIIGR